MRLDPDCVRDILLQVEAIEALNGIPFPNFAKSLPKYSYDVLTYHCIILEEAGMIAANIKNAKSPLVVRIFRMKHDGHILLEHIREESFWNKFKSGTKKFGVDVMSAFISFATTNAFDQLKELFLNAVK